MDTSAVEHYLNLAREASRRAHNPYSRFSVGCVLLDRDAGVHLGCNIESASYSATLCAERVAASQAIAAGVREWDSLFVVSPTRVSPCGVCRQFLYEFAPELPIYMGFLEGSEYLGPVRLLELLPMGMTLNASELGRKE